MIAKSSDAIAELLTTFGIDKRRVASLTIECRPRAAAVAIVELYLEEQDVHTLSGTIKQRFKLVEFAAADSAERMEKALDRIAEFSSPDDAGEAAKIARAALEGQS